MEASRAKQSATDLPGNPGPVSGALYDELRRLARLQMRRERGNHTLQPTALVHEAYARLMHSPENGAVWQSRAHFLAAASQAMRHILVDYARARHADKRGACQRQVTLDDSIAGNIEPTGGRSLDVLVLNEALDELEKLDRRQCRVVELHFFGGLTFEEIADLLGIAVRTVKRDWSMARCWLFNWLSKCA